MFFPFPIRTEKETVKLPYLTMGLILLNLGIWLFTNRIVSGEARDMNEIQSRMFEIEDEFISTWMDEDPRSFFQATPDEVHERYYREVAKGSNDEVDVEWLALYGEHKARSRNTFFHRWGFIPARFSFLKLLVSVFIHANFFHMFGNMLFLWAVGCNLEDDWGWWGFLVCYLLAGVTAGGLHAMKSMASDVPCIGASGAIAGVMGIFLVKYYNVKIRFFYLWLLRFWKPWGFFTSYAYVVIPIWFVQQVIGISTGSDDGVGYWAHIGGFLFGAGVAGTFRLLGLDDKEAATGVEAGREAGEFRVDPKTPLAAQARAALQADPSNVRRYFFYARAFAGRGQEKNAALLYNMGLDRLFASKDLSSLSPAFRELSGRDYLDHLSEKNLYRTAAGLETIGQFEEAVGLYIQYANRYPEGRAREKALSRAYVVLRDNVGNDFQAQKALALLMREYPDTKLHLQAAAAVKPQDQAEPAPAPRVQEPVNELFMPA